MWSACKESAEFPKRMHTHTGRRKPGEHMSWYLQGYFTASWWNHGFCIYTVFTLSNFCKELRDFNSLKKAAMNMLTGNIKPFNKICLWYECPQLGPRVHGVWYSWNFLFQGSCSYPMVSSHCTHAGKAFILSNFLQSPRIPLGSKMYRTQTRLLGYTPEWAVTHFLGPAQRRRVQGREQPSFSFAHLERAHHTCSSPAIPTHEGRLFEETIPPSPVTREGWKIGTRAIHVLCICDHDRI